MDAKTALKGAGHRKQGGGSKKDGQSMLHKSKRLARRTRGVVEKNKKRTAGRQKNLEAKQHAKREARLVKSHGGKARPSIGIQPISGPITEPCFVPIYPK
jgi:hypothetical protein